MAIGLPVKANYAAGDILTATNMNDLSGTLNNVATSYGNAAGKNKIINGDFGVWQRGTSFTTSGTYTSDRWQAFSNATFTASRQSFTAGAAPVTGYESPFFYRFDKSAGGSFASLLQKIEDVRTYANQTITISFWAKANTSATIIAYAAQDFGSGGSSSVLITSTNVNITSSWARYSVTANVPSITGKTIGTNSFFNLEIQYVNSAALTLDIWGVQIEAGSIATPFQTASGGSIQGELAMCQRYYFRQNPTGSINVRGQGIGVGASSARIACILPVTMRILPSAVDFSTLGINDTSTTQAVTAISIAGSSSPNIVVLDCTVASGLTQFRPYFLTDNSSFSAFLGFTAEL